MLQTGMSSMAVTRALNTWTSRTVLSNPALHKKRKNLEKRNVKILLS